MYVIDRALTNSMFCQFQCYDYGHNIIPCDPTSVDASGEYYDMAKDQWQLSNAVQQLCMSLLALLGPTFVRTLSSSSSLY
jgi:hypothetical protein